ncbi:hypothetical protein TNCT_118551 [Trichonephila clavata]|uniref:Uncharacterized protein n=1 Tax=Trichonephila clavata TaxID=2740835 RepID=A0A8X6K6Q7_TRICU|nr:hypothetical protein TNCT_118551 [Trichonephila clavata]
MSFPVYIRNAIGDYRRKKGNRTCVFNALGAAEPSGEAYPWLTPTDPIHIGRKSQNNLLIPRKIMCDKTRENSHERNTSRYAVHVGQVYNLPLWE